MMHHWRLRLCLSILGAAALVQSAPAAHAKDTTADHTPNLNLPSLTQEAQIRISKSPVEKYDLSSLADLEALSARIKALEQTTDYSKDKALKEAGDLADEAITLNKAGLGQTAQMGTVLTHLNIVLEAFNHEYMLPVPPQLDIFGALGYLTEDMATGRTEAGNVPKDESKHPERVKLPNSSFWSDPDDPDEIAKKNLFQPVKGKPVNLKGTVCEYTAPKTSFGIKGGFEIACGKDGYKLKFGSESRTEPFNSRIYHALGFNVPTVEYTPGVEVKYDRNIFKHFQDRRELTTNFSIFGITIYKETLGGYLDPFHFIKGAKLSNGQEIATAELYQRLFPKAESRDRPLVDNPSTPPICDPDRYPECNNARYDTTFESMIVSLTTVEGSLEVKDKDVDSLGPWDWDTPSYAELREVRAAGIVSMWVGNYDVRWDNNRVRTVKDKSGKKLGMFISDIGAGLGNALNPLRVDNDAPMEFAWRFTAGRDDRNFYSRGDSTTADGRIGAQGFAIIDFLPVMENKLLKKITRADAAWTAQMIADLTEDQIKSALIAAGFESAEVFLLTHKLLNRREHLLRDTTGDGPTLRRSEMFCNYDPMINGQMTATLPDGRIVKARAQKYVLKDLKLVPGDPTMHLPGEYSDP